MPRTGPLPVRTTSPIVDNLKRMEFHINLEGGTDLSGAIYRQMRDAIVEGRLRAGDRVPPTRHLARRLGVARMTVTVAYDRPVAEGFVTTRVGAGTFVTEQAARQSPDRRRPSQAARMLSARRWRSLTGIGVARMQTRGIASSVQIRRLS